MSTRTMISANNESFDAFTTRITKYVSAQYSEFLSTTRREFNEAVCMYLKLFLTISQMMMYFGDLKK